MHVRPITVWRRKQRRARVHSLSVSLSRVSLVRSFDLYNAHLFPKGNCRLLGETETKLARKLAASPRSAVFFSRGVLPSTGSRLRRLRKWGWRCATSFPLLKKLSRTRSKLCVHLIFHFVHHHRKRRTGKGNSLEGNLLSPTYSRWTLNKSEILSVPSSYKCDIPTATGWPWRNSVDRLSCARTRWWHNKFLYFNYFVFGTGLVGYSAEGSCGRRN